jgi:hypothetical protein
MCSSTFGVAFRGESLAHRLKPALQLARVIELTVVGDRPSTDELHWLSAGRSGVDDRERTMAEARRRSAVEDSYATSSIGPAMRDRICHCLDFASYGTADNGANSTHCRVSSPSADARESASRSSATFGALLESSVGRVCGYQVAGQSPELLHVLHEELRPDVGSEQLRGDDGNLRPGTSRSTKLQRLRCL